MLVVTVAVLLLIGGLLAVQGAANVQLGSALGSPVSAAGLQLAVGAALLVTLAIVVPGTGALAALGQLPEVTPWELAGGLGSAIYITAGILLLPRLGAVVMVGLFITGQMLASALIDVFGLFGVPATPLGTTSAVGLAAVLGAAVLLTRSQPRATGTSARIPAVLAAVVAGAALPVQGAVNAALGVELRAPVAVSAISFLVATVAMALVGGAVVAAGGRRPALRPLRRLPWWGWLGGFVGAAYVTAVFLLIPVIGTAATVGLTVAGQQLASVALDRYGLLRVPRRPVGTRRLVGVGLLLAGVAALQFS